ncbi:MAG TPA: ATP-binding protein [Polyangiaceae bacterium]
MNPRALWLWMVLAIATVAAIAYWDAQREFAAALSDFASEQTAIARAIATTLPSSAAAVRAVERPRSVRVFVSEPANVGLTASDGQRVRSASIETALANGAVWLRLTRAEAASLGLPARAAVAGLTRVDTADAGHWGIVVVASALRERDRERFALWRLALSVVVASGLVLVFGGLAQRNQEKQLRMAQELAVAAAQSESDERLVRADKLATMGALATGIAHEVSTPLGVIVGRAEQLRGKLQDDERSKRALSAIVEQADRISAIVRGFLALARGDSPRSEQVRPEVLADVAIDLVTHRFVKADVQLSCRLEQNLPNVACEPRLMEQVLVNLLLNACDACQPGGHVELRVARDGQRVAFAVTDDGSGISEAAAARILDPFFTTKPIGQGSGLGLAIANELVKHHHGKLTVASRPGQRGTKACVELPSATETSNG